MLKDLLSLLIKCGQTNLTLVLVMVMVLSPGHYQMVNDFGQEHDNDLRPELGSR